MGSKTSFKSPPRALTSSSNAVNIRLWQRKRRKSWQNDGNQKEYPVASTMSWRFNLFSIRFFFLNDPTCTYFSSYYWLKFLYWHTKYFSAIFKAFLKFISLSKSHQPTKKKVVIIFFWGLSMFLKMWIWAQLGCSL